MELKEAILSRRSIRGFKKDAVSQEVLREVLRLGTRAVSARNIQPWEFSVVTGSTLQELSLANVNALTAGEKPDFSYPPTSGDYETRGRTIGRLLLHEMDIAREDKEGRLEWLKRGYRFFDAPVGILISMDKALNEPHFRLDIGCVTQNICLAAMEFGLATCVEIQPVMYQKETRRILGLSADKQLMIAIAVGYPDWEFPANRVVSEREDVDKITHWYGF